MAQLVKNLPAMQETPVHDSWVGKFPQRRERLPSPVFLGSPGILGLQTVKNPPAMRETWVRSLGWEDPLDEGMATHSSILASRIPVDRGAWRAAVHGIKKKSDMTEQLSTLYYTLIFLIISELIFLKVLGNDNI